MSRSKESIRTGKVSQSVTLHPLSCLLALQEWILSHCHCADAITITLKDAARSFSDFDRKLNIVYLVSDVLFNCVKRVGPEKDNMSNALARDLVFILREAYYGQKSEDQDKVSPSPWHPTMHVTRDNTGEQGGGAVVREADSRCRVCQNSEGGDGQ